VFIDITIPLAHNLQPTVTEKQHKYQDLTLEIKQQWQLNKIIVIPLILSAMGCIPKMLNQSLTNLNLPPCLLSQAQQVVTLNTCYIVQKFLSDEVHVPDKEAHNA
jgi:hypothetical protein